MKFSKTGRIVAISLAMILIGGLVGALYQQSVDQQLARDAAIAQLDADQKALYQATIKAQMQTPEYPLSNGTSSNGTTYNVKINQWTAKLFVSIFYAVSGHGTEVNQTLLKQGYISDCLSQCYSGINYFKDPTTLIVDTGRCWEQDAVFSGTASACAVTFPAVGTAFAIYEGWSVDTHVPAHGDTYGGGATIPCSSNNLIVDANGLRDVAMTVTLGGAGTTVSTTMSKSFSITGTYTSVQVSCVIVGSGTNADANANPQIYAEGTFGPDTFHSGDSLTGTWVVSRT